MKPVTQSSTERRQLEPGMFLFAPAGTDGPRDEVWCVSSAGKKSAVIIAHHETIRIKATLRTGQLPEGWRLVNHAPLAKMLAEIPTNENAP